MKHRFLVVGVLLCGSLFASTAHRPLLEKRFMNGLVSPVDAREKECRLLPTAVAGRYQVVTHTIIGSGASSIFSDSTETRVIELQVEITKLIAEAARGKMVTQPAPTDGPITEWAAYENWDSSAPVRQVLRARGSELVDNQSAAAITLVNLIDSVCQWAN